MGYDNIVSTYKIVKAAKGEMWMFGYLLPYKPELKMREFECGTETFSEFFYQ